MKVSLTLVFGLLFAVGIGAAQSGSPVQTFEAATIKPRTGDYRARAAVSPDRFASADITLRGLIEYAYELTSRQVAGGPEWIGTDRFAVEAKAKAIPTRVEMRMLMRGLLEDRFNLKAHIETREMPVYLLDRLRSDGALGRLLVPTPNFECPATAEKKDAFQEPSASSCGTISASPVRILARGVTMSQFARNMMDLGSMTGVDRIVVDQTNLPGSYNIESLSYRPVETALLPGGDGNALFFDAIREQLGLKLTPARASVNVLVVDSATKPSPD